MKAARRARGSSPGRRPCTRSLVEEGLGAARRHLILWLRAAERPS